VSVGTGLGGAPERRWRIILHAAFLMRSVAYLFLAVRELAVNDSRAWIMN